MGEDYGSSDEGLIISRGVGQAGTYVKDFKNLLSRCSRKELLRENERKLKWMPFTESYRTMQREIEYLNNCKNIQH